MSGNRWSGVRLVLASVTALFAISAAAPSFAQSAEGDDWGNDDSDADFDDFPDEVTPTDAPAPEKSSPLTVTGIYRSDLHGWTERFGDAPGDAPMLAGGNDNPFAKARAAIDIKAKYKRDWLQAQLVLHGEYDFALLHRSDEYDIATKRAFETLRDPLLGDAPIQLREAFVAASLGDVELTLGRQIVAWGEGDGLSPLDVVNPRDMREPGLADLDDIRVPVLATRVGWFSGNHRVEAMVTHEAHWGFRNPPLGPFSPFPTLIEQNPIAKSAGVVDKMRRDDVDFADTPGHLSSDGFQYLLRWVRKGAGADLGLYAGSVIDRQGVISGFTQKEQGQLIAKSLNDTTDEIRLNMAHLRYAIFGTSGAVTYRSFLIKWELALHKSHPYNFGTFSSVSTVRCDQLDTMLGVTYTGVSNTMIGLEASKATLLDLNDALLFPIDAPFIMLRVSHNALRERLKLMAVASMIGETAQYGWLARANATYELADGYKVSLGYITYQPTEKISPFAGLDRHDRVMAQFRWDFRLM